MRKSNLSPFFTLFLSVATWAHDPGISFTDFTILETTVQGEMRVNFLELNKVLPVEPVLSPNQAAGILLPQTRRVDEATIQRNARRVFEGTLETLALTQESEPCSLSPEKVQFEAPDTVVARGTWTCPKPIDVLRIQVGFSARAFPGHVHLATLRIGEELDEHVLKADNDSFEVLGRSKPLQRAGRFFALGLEHLFTGYDHIAFLLGLLLIAGSFKDLVKVVTSFTVAHSLTLAAATLGVFAPSPALIEPLIAASIVYVAAENFWETRKAVSDGEVPRTRGRWVLAFVFGLIHGFGFASVIRPMHLPTEALAIALVSFNLGVEAGQLCIVAVVFPVLVHLRRRALFNRKTVWALSGVIGALGLFWLFQRLLG
jgi:hypothetical protein